MISLSSIPTNYLDPDGGLVVQNGRVTREERFLGHLNERIREVRQGPDGYLYLLTDSPQGRILRVKPAA